MVTNPRLKMPSLANSVVAAAPKKARKVRGIVYVDNERCKGCGFCVEFCPQDCLVLAHEFNSKGYHPPVLSDEDACTGCDLCALYCPDFAIFSTRVQAAGDGGGR